MKRMMERCMKGCKWCPLIPVIIGIVSFLLGYFLNADVVRVLWLICSIGWILMGIFCLIMMRVMINVMGNSESPDINCTCC